MPRGRRSPDRPCGGIHRGSWRKVRAHRRGCPDNDLGSVGSWHSSFAGGKALSVRADQLTNVRRNDNPLFPVAAVVQGGALGPFGRAVRPRGWSRRYCTPALEGRSCSGARILLFTGFCTRQRRMHWVQSNAATPRRAVSSGKKSVHEGAFSCNACAITFPYGG